MEPLHPRAGDGPGALALMGKGCAIDGLNAMSVQGTRIGGCFAQCGRLMHYETNIAC